MPACTLRLVLLARATSGAHRTQHEPSSSMMRTGRERNGHGYVSEASGVVEDGLDYSICDAGVRDAAPATTGFRPLVQTRAANDR